ncbi:uncharacterized protein LOC144551847 [Carex rostrata]
MATKSLILNLTIDNSRNKVLFAESDKDFVDVLLSFLTIPLGTLVSISNKNSLLCLDNLYKSVEDLSNEYFKTTPCREMLLRPNFAAEIDCLDLPLNVQGDRALIYYTCSQNCPHELLSSYANAMCSCGRKMVRKVKAVRGSSTKEPDEGVFLKCATRFLITDNFTVTPASTQAAFNLLGCAGTSLSSVVEKQVSVGLSEIIAILRQSLISEDTFTNVFLEGENANELEKKNSPFALVSHPKPCSDPTDNFVGIKLIVDKHKNKVLYAECNQDFIDILFSFLTYPSGFVIKSLNGKSHITCLDNLFATVLIKPMADCFKTDETKEYMVNPRLFSHFRSTKSLVKSDEAIPARYYMCRTPDCVSTEVSLVPNVQCKCARINNKKTITNKKMKITDPRTTRASGLSDQGYVSVATYIVTDDLVVTPFSVSTLTRMIANASEGVVEIPVNIGEKEVLALLEAALGSQAVFTDSFLVNEETTTNAICDDDSDCVIV